MMIYLVILLAIIVAAALAWSLRKSSSGSATALRRRYSQLMFLSGKETEKSLQYQLEAASKKYPGRSEQWYLEKILLDLERDRR